MKAQAPITQLNILTFSIALSPFFILQASHAAHSIGGLRFASGVHSPLPLAQHVQHVQ
jgi:hypothetical protein